MTKVQKPSPIAWWAYWGVVGLWLTTILFASLLASLFISFLVEPIKTEIKNVFGIEWYLIYWLVVFTVLLIYFLPNFEKQTSDEWGLKLFWGSRIMQVTKHGPVHVLWPLFTLSKLPKSSQQNQYPAESKDIDWEVNVGDKPAEGKVAPIRATTAAGDPKKAETDPTEHRFTFNLSTGVTYKIIDPIKFTLVMGAGDGGLDNARKQIEDLAVGMMIASIGQKTPGWIIGNVSDFGLILERATQELANGRRPKLAADGSLVAGGKKDPHSDWGVEIISAQIVRHDIPKTINEAMRNVPAAAFAKQATILAAEGEEERLRKEGRGTAAAKAALEQAGLDGVADGMAYLKERTGLNPAQIAALLAANKLAESPNAKIVLGERVVTELPGQIAKAIGQIGTAPTSP